MTAKTSVAPLLQYCIFCDGIAIHSDGKFSLVGVFDAILRPKVQIPHFNIVTCWSNGLGDHEVKVRLLTPKLAEAIPNFDAQISLSHRTQQVRLVFNPLNFTFETRGVYWVEVSLNQEIVASIPLPVGKKSVVNKNT